MAKKQTIPDDANTGVDSTSIRVRENYVEYGTYVIENRAIPDFRDGSKPSQRRILYAMKRLGADKDKFFKSARVTGDVIGKYHPHGDAAVYGALVELAHTRYPMVEGQGNFGEVLDPPAAARYTECRLSKLAREHFACLDVAEMTSNYSNDDVEPVVTNTRLPLLLMNGVSGVAVGMSTDIPSHNLREVCAAVEHVVRNFKTANPASITALLRGPDCVRGGILLSKPEEVAAVYGAGRGALDFQCDYRFERDGAYQNIIVFGFPDAFQIKPFLKKCNAMVTEKRLKYVETDYEMPSGKKSQDDKRFIIRIGTDNKPAIERVVEMLRCRQTYQFNVTTRSGDSVTVQSMGILEMIKSWIVWRSQEEKKLLELDDKDRRKQLFRESAKLKAAENLKVVFAALQQDSETPEAYLQRALSIDEDSAKLITDLKVGDLRRANVDVQRKKIDEINKTLAQIADDLAHLPRVIVKNLRALEPFFDERRTRIGARGPQINRVETEGDPFVVAANADGKLYSVDETGTTSSALMSAGTFDGVAVFGASGVVGLFSVSEMQGKAGTGLDKIVGIAPVEADYFIGVGINGFGNKIESTPKSMPAFIKDTDLLYGGPAWESSTLMLWGNGDEDFRAIRVSDLKTMRKNVKGFKLASFKIERALLARADQVLLTKDGTDVDPNNGEGLLRTPIFVVGSRNLVQLKSGRRKFLSLDELRADIVKNDVIAAQDVSLPGH